ncbi:MAG TPA: MBL fold metallo-hydrolase [Thermoanaerobaculia bacterium]|nr:MBL fold metallo-hydrolase [Thermoanaerobaculia bacterium]
MRLTDSEIYLDPAESRATAILSHAHSDHIGRHDFFVATAPTASFLRARNGHDLKGSELRYGQAVTIEGYEIDLFPAGHILGSAMVRVRRENQTLLYTGDFRLRPSFTAEPAEIPKCDSLIMESTYGSPECKFPPRDLLRSQLQELARSITSRGKTAVLLAYSLGKAQETCRMLAGSGLQVVMHPVAARLSEIYEKHGVNLGDFEIWSLQSQMFAHRATTDLRAKVLIIAPHMRSDIRRIRNKETVALTGWALGGRPRTTDHALPLSDHADFEELLEIVERSSAEIVHVTHGSSRFARELRARGVRAEFLRVRPQMKLF